MSDSGSSGGRGRSSGSSGGRGRSSGGRGRSHGQLIYVPKKTQSSSSSSMSLSPPTRPVSDKKILYYEKIPSSHRRIFYLNSDVGTKDDYSNLIEYIITMSTIGGVTYDGLRRINTSKEHELLEIQLVCGKDSLKLLVSTLDLYLYGYVSRQGSFQYCTHHIDIKGFHVMEKDVTYKFKHSLCGPAMIRKAIQVLNKEMETLDSTDFSEFEDPKDKYIASLEVFILHVSEAARFVPIKKKIMSTLEPVKDHKVFPINEELESIFPKGKSGQLLATEVKRKFTHDVFNEFVKEKHGVDLDTHVIVPSWVNEMVHSYRKLSDIYYVYWYSFESKVFNIEEEKLYDELSMDNMKKLKNILGLLNGSNLLKVFRNQPSGYSDDLYKLVIKELKKGNLIFDKDEAEKAEKVEKVEVEDDVEKSS